MSIEKSWLVRIEAAVTDVVASMEEEELVEAIEKPVRFDCPPHAIVIDRSFDLAPEVSVVFHTPVDALTLAQAQRISALMHMSRSLDEMRQWHPPDEPPETR